MVFWIVISLLSHVFCIVISLINIPYRKWYLDKILFQVAHHTLCNRKYPDIFRRFNTWRNILVLWDVKNVFNFKFCREDFVTMQSVADNKLNEKKIFEIHLYHKMLDVICSWNTYLYRSCMMSVCICLRIKLIFIKI